jgi:glucose/arabinose dehydrogenase
VSPTASRTFRTAAATTPVPGAGTWIVQEGYAVEPAATPGAFGLPVNIAFVPNPGPNPTDPLFYVTELYGSIKTVARNGQVSTYASGLLDYNPSGPFPGAGEQGLSGIAVDPASGDLFVAMLWNNGTSDATRGAANLHYPKVERLHSTDGGRTMATRALLLNMQPETQGQSHQISNVSFGPDGKLYVHMGDGFAAASALNLDQYRGKVLRMNPDGSAPADNPFYNAGNGINARDYVYTYGHRNPFGGAWRASNNAHYVVENGNSIDRMARLAAGQSYGWNGDDPSLIATSLYNWNPSTAPVNMTFVQPQTFGGSLFPASSHDDAFVSMSGPTYAAGPQVLGKRIEWFSDLDTLNGSGKLAVPPTTLVRYNGTGRGTVAALAAGPTGLYFADIYREDGVGGPTAAGASVYRLRYVDFHPAGVTATAGDARVTVNWTPDPLAATHNVYRSVGNGAPVLVGAGVGGTSFTDPTAVNGTRYDYVVRGVNAGGESNDSNEASATPAAGVPPLPQGTGNGLAAVYFNNPDLTGTSVVRTDAAVNFDFGAAAPDPFIAPDTFSARWVGFIEPRFTETYTLTTTSDDGVRLWVDNVPVIDQWNDHTATRHSGTIALVAGQRHAVRLEYYQNAGPASVGLEWQSASQPAEVVPQSQLYSGAPVRVNFQPLRARRAAVEVPPGYVADNGAIFADRGNGYAYGWARKNGGGRDRNHVSSPDQRYDTYLPLRKRAWELSVPNGTYRVHVVSGDPRTFRGAFKANVEGVPAIDGSPSTGQRWLEGWADVVVADGRLTISTAPRARKNKINFVDVIPLDAVGGGAAALTSAPAVPAPAAALVAAIPHRAEAAPSGFGRASITRDLFAPAE